jgi:holo-[acyl-carrier protein] synthase
MNQILGTGVDLVEPTRIAQSLEKFSSAFIERILTPNERAEFALVAPALQVNFLAKRFAAKEAASKALGTGIRGAVSFQSFEVSYTPLGQPQLNADAKLTATFAKSEQAKANRSLRFHLSFSDTQLLIIAFVIVEIIEL